MLITLDEAKAHLEITHESEDDEIQAKAEEASGIVLDYLKRPADSWQDTNGEPQSVPYNVRAAVKLVLGALMENREGDEALPQPLSKAAMDLLHRYRDPALA